MAGGAEQGAFSVVLAARESLGNFGQPPHIGGHKGCAGRFRAARKATTVATLGLNPDEQRAVEAFRRDIVDPSMTKLVILDFWAEWCGPCKQLTPVLEKVAADYANKGVLLAKINVDEQKMIAAQFRVQSIPTVYAVFQGQLVADLTQFRTEVQNAAESSQGHVQLLLQSMKNRCAARLCVNCCRCANMPLRRKPAACSKPTAPHWPPAPRWSWGR